MQEYGTSFTKKAASVHAQETQTREAEITALKHRLATAAVKHANELEKLQGQLGHMSTQREAEAEWLRQCQAQIPYLNGLLSDIREEMRRKSEEFEAVARELKHCKLQLQTVDTQQRMRSAEDEERRMSKQCDPHAKESQECKQRVADLEEGLCESSQGQEHLADADHTAIEARYTGTDDRHCHR